MVLVSHMELVYFPVNITGITPFPLEAGFAGGDVKVVGVFAYDTNTGIAPNGLALVSQSDAAAITVTLCDTSGQVVAEVPYRDFQRDQTAGIWYAFQPFRIDLTKCYVRANAPLTSERSVALSFAFVRD